MKNDRSEWGEHDAGIEVAPLVVVLFCTVVAVIATVAMCVVAILLVPHLCKQRNQRQDTREIQSMRRGVGRAATNERIKIRTSTNLEPAR